MSCARIMKKLFRASVSVNFEMFIAADGPEEAEESAQACARGAIAKVDPDLGPVFRVRELASDSESDSDVYTTVNGHPQNVGLGAGAYLEALREEQIKAEAKKAGDGG